MKRMKHIKLFENIRAYEDSSKFGEGHTNSNRRYLFVEMFNGDTHSNPTIEIHNNENDAKKSFLVMVNAQVDKKISKHTNKVRKWDLILSLLENGESGHEYDFEDGFDGDSMRLIVDELKPGKSYVLKLHTTVLDYELYEYDSLEGAEIEYNELIDIHDWEEVETLNTRDDGYVSGYDEQYYTYIQLIK